MSPAKEDCIRLGSMVTWFGTSGNDTTQGSAADDKLWDRAGNDVLRGGSGFDHIYGEIRQFIGIVRGLAGDDVIYGFNFRDWLDGGECDDRLVGAGAPNRLTGGSGRDDFQFGRPTDSSTVDGGRGIDRIDDFMPGLDDLVFSGSFDADSTLPGRQKLSFIGLSASAERGELAYRAGGAGDTFVFSNTDDDPDPEFQILILGSANIADDDVLIH